MASWPRAGLQVLVVEQLAAAEARAVEDQGFGQGGDVGRSRELAHLDLAAGDLHVADHLAEVAAGLDVHRVVAQRAVHGNGFSAAVSIRFTGGKLSSSFASGLSVST